MSDAPETGSRPGQGGSGEVDERMMLAGLLDRNEEVFDACRHALLQGAYFETGSGEVLVRDVIETYEVRESVLRERGIPTLGFPDALRDLQESTVEKVLIGSVSSELARYLFVLFLTVDRSRVVGCIGVDQDPQHRKPVR